MALSSDEIIKRELKDKVGSIGKLKLWIFPQSSNEDQKVFPQGLTFGIDGVAYGSCDACWVTKNDKWLNPYNNHMSEYKPVLALEGTDALNRGSSGNAQYQRFHHALGAVKCGIIGVYYLRKGKDKIQEDLYGMAYFASKVEKGIYLIIDDLNELKTLLQLISSGGNTDVFIDKKLESMYKIFSDKFNKEYGSWENFAKRRSTIIKEGYIIKYSGRMRRNFTDGSQRAGHIAVGEMYLTKYFFPEKKFYYLWPKMNKDDIAYLDEHKSDDKEWKILRNEPGVEIITIEDLEGVPAQLKRALFNIRNEPLKGRALEIFNKAIRIIGEGLISNKIKIKGI